MICAWKELMAILPQWLRAETDKPGFSTATELRLRCNVPPEIVTLTGSIWLGGNITSVDLQYVINTASRYSPWAAETLSQGYITASGGHRIGICGEVVCHNGTVTGVRNVESLCIRIARDHPGIGTGVPGNGSVLILGAPGWGKTTLLRDISRILAEKETVAVVDERGELFPAGFPRGKRMDVLTGCGKTEGISRVLRTMGPNYITVDEITADRDCESILQAYGCGVKLLASAHASSLEDMKRRPVYRPILDWGVFDHYLVLDANRHWRLERSRP